MINWKIIDNKNVELMIDVNHEHHRIGHLRGDFGRSGKEFWTSWFDHNPALKTREFRDEFQTVVEETHAKGGILESFTAMMSCGYDGRSLDGWYGRDCYGFQYETAHHLYLLRTIPTRGDYNFYLYCFKKGE